MLRIAFTCLILGLAAGLLGSAGIAEPFAEIAKIMATIFSIFGVLSLFGSETRRGSLG
jgi:uncharacterized membrane protein YtjA (UPF0391 family)